MSTSPTRLVVEPPRAAPSLARRLVLAALARISVGTLVVEDGWGRQRFGGLRDPGLLKAYVRVQDPRAYRDILARGVLGAGEAYAEGRWTSPDLVDALRLFVRNRSVLESLDSGSARLARALLAGWNALRVNTRGGSRRNIAAHYDLGNEFFGLFLDETMTYSCGIFEHEGASLADASRAKYERIAAKLHLRPEHQVLEIGCGWGGFAEHVARRHGCRVTALTISEAQHAYASERVRRSGLEDRVTVLNRDYRDVEGRYDRVVSIEMIEAVGHRHLPLYLRVIRDRLRDDGLAVLQAITIRDDLYERARRTVDFIKRHVFPGSFIPSVAAITAAMAHNTDLRLVHLEDIGAHYARTLGCWRTRLLARADDVRALGFSDSFVRAWEYYFAYCEAGFAERQLGDVQLLLTGPDARNPCGDWMRSVDNADVLPERTKR